MPFLEPPIVHASTSDTFMHIHIQYKYSTHELISDVFALY